MVMNITVSSIRCCLQVALLGAITENLRAVAVELDSNLIKIYFYYDSSPSEEEKDIAETISSEVISDYPNLIEVKIYQSILPIKTKIPNVGIRVFHRREF
jgi:hypothetical protein